MKAIELTAFQGVDGLRAIETATPQPGPTEVLIEVKASLIQVSQTALVANPPAVGFSMGYSTEWM